MFKIMLYKNKSLVFEKEGVPDGDCIKFDDIFYNLKNYSLIRENSDYKYTLDFNNEEATVELKEKNFILPLGINVKKKDITSKKHVIIYSIDSDNESENILEISLNFK